MIEAIIIKLPPGEVPQWVKQAYLLMRIIVQRIEGHTATGVITGKRKEYDQDLYAMSQSEFIGILSTRDARAAAWWTKHGFPHPGRLFVFPRDVLHIMGDGTDGWG